MSEEERKGNQHLKTSKLANASFYFGILTWLVVFAGMIFVLLLDVVVALRHDFSYTARHVISIIVRSWFVITFVMSIVATVCGFISLVYIKFTRSVLKGAVKAFIGFALGISYCVIFCVSVHTYYIYLRPKMTRFQCGKNLDSIYESMLTYATDFDHKYPPKDKWCDLLIKHTRINKREFICPDSKTKTGQSSYAINENAIILEPPIMRGMEEPNTPANIVLLFESESGWNQYGGPELLTFKHHVGKVWIIFTDGHRDFISPEEFDNLKWKPDEDQEE